MMKSPVPLKGRIGPERWQDWYLICEKAASLPSDEVLIVSAFEEDGGSDETGVYERMLKSMGSSKIRVVKEGLETIGQLDAIFKIIEKERCEVTIISSLLHFPRILWLCRRYVSLTSTKPILHFKITLGIPRPREALTDILLTFLFPIIDLLGKRGVFQKKTIERRKKGLV